MLLILLPLSISATSLVEKWTHSDCVRPWQTPIMSVATIRIPSRPVTCDPDVKNSCPSTHATCQFSLKSFKYVCCRNKEDSDILSCPKQHETLLVSCELGSENACPAGFRCMTSETNDDVNLCCKPNLNMTVEEPYSSFRENKLIPMVLPRAPLKELKVNFTETIIMGQLFDSTRIQNLSDAPSIVTADFDDEKVYTILLLDQTTKTKKWLMINVPSIDGALQMRSKTVVSYTHPGNEEKPEGLHLMILLVLEQSKPWTTRDLAFYDEDPFILRDWLAASEGLLQKAPVAGTFYAFSTLKDDRRV